MSSKVLYAQIKQWFDCVNKLPFEGLCVVCNREPTQESHHVYPKHLGGPVDGITVGLCGNHHTQVHRLANSILKNQVWPSLGPIGDRLAWFIAAATKNYQELHVDQINAIERNLPLKIPHHQLQKMHRRKTDLGFSNMHDYVQHLINKDLGAA